MATESTPAKVRLNDLLGHADEAQPLLERLEEGGCSPYCDSLEREAAAEIQSLQESYGQLLAESVRLRAKISDATTKERERIARAWDGCVHEGTPCNMDIGASIRAGELVPWVGGA